MKQEQIIRKVSKIGNGAHVFAPKEWVDEEVMIVRILKPKSTLKEEIINLLLNYTEDVLGVYLIGSYARGEQTARSDVDVLVITDGINKRIKKGKYDILFLSEDALKKQLKTNILPLLLMIREAKSLINPKLIEKYKNTPLTKRNLKFHIETTKSALNVNKEVIELDKSFGDKSSDASAYSLILRLRGIYLVDCLIKDKRWSNKEFVQLVKKIAGSEEAYKGYLRSKEDKRSKENLNPTEAEKLYNYILEKIKEQERWVKRKK